MNRTNRLKQLGIGSIAEIIVKKIAKGLIVFIEAEWIVSGN